RPGDRGGSAPVGDSGPGPGRQPGGDHAPAVKGEPRICGGTGAEQNLAPWASRLVFLLVDDWRDGAASRYGPAYGLPRHADFAGFAVHDWALLRSDLSAAGHHLYLRPRTISN